MKAETESHRFIYHTQGVCPPEIHFQLSHHLLEEIRFVGGGCPGNAQLVSRLIRGRPVEEILPLLENIQCREKTSCPDQLSVALRSVLNGTLQPAEAIRIRDDLTAHKQVGLVGVLDGNVHTLQTIIQGMQSRGVNSACCMGNFTGDKRPDKDVIKLLRQQKQVNCIQGERDWSYTNNTETGTAFLATKDRDWVAMLPQLLTFLLGNRKAVAFYGDYLQNLPGFSDFAPFALEMNMVCGLTDFMGDETVFPALEAMTPQFQCDVILFGQREEWGQWRVGDKEFVSVGRSENGANAKWGLLETTSGDIMMEIIEEPM